jgi:hypothetical protein
VLSNQEKAMSVKNKVIEVIQALIAACGAQTFGRLAGEVLQQAPNVSTPNRAIELTREALKALLAVNRLRSGLVDGEVLYGYRNDF